MPSEKELSYWYRSQRLESVTTILLAVINAIWIIGIAFFFWASVRDLAGKYTVANIGLGLNSNIKFADILSILFGGGGVAYGKYQQKLKRDAIQRLAPRAAEKEQKLDPNRSSSRLTKRGQTPPEIKR